jgi:hypothetical protein
MKKTMTAPLCSGLVIPGLGQILNRQIRKGLILMGLVFVLLIAGVLKLSSILNSMSHLKDLTDSSRVAQISGGDMLVIAGVSGAFALIWLYSVVDAFWVAFRSERSVQEQLR